MKKHKVLYNVDDKIGKWTLLETCFDKRNSLCWKCKCECGNTQIVRQAVLNRGDSLKCKKCCTQELGKLNKKDDFLVGSNGIYIRYKSNAKRRGLIFNLTIDQFRNLIKQDCFYCGKSPSNICKVYSGRYCKDRNITYNGIDRIDNEKGYEITNCIPCCHQCNYSKSNFTQEQFFKWIKDIYLKQFKRLAEKTPAIMMDELFTINMKLWFEQEKIMKSPPSSKEALDSAKKAQELNAKRNKLIRAIDEILDFSEFTLTDKTY